VRQWDVSNWHVVWAQRVLQPMLHKVQEYQQHNHNELVRVVTASQMIQREWDKRLDFSSAAIDGDGNGDDGGEVKIKGDHDFTTFGRWSTVLMSYVLVEIHEESAVD
jgi:hypothetical protein